MKKCDSCKHSHYVEQTIIDSGDVYMCRLREEYLQPSMLLYDCKLYVPDTFEKMEGKIS
jgi:hypothetical protein